jgi:prevent-host-death family protein
MSDVASRDLRNNTRAVLDRVAAGEDVTITVDGRAVATLRSVARRPRFIPRAEFVATVMAHQADRDLRRVLRDLAPDTTDDL